MEGARHQWPGRPRKTAPLGPGARGAQIQQRRASLGPPRKIGLESRAYALALPPADGEESGAVLAVPGIPDGGDLGYTLSSMATPMPALRRWTYALVDPVVGGASDRSRSRLGRRRIFLLWGMAPMCLLPALLFWPPAEPGSVANAWWAGGLLSLYFFFFTVYVGPIWP